MANLAREITLDSIIVDAIDRMELSPQKYNKLWHIAFSGMDDMGLSFFYKVRTVKVPVSAQKTVQFPTDCINYIKIGVLNNNGEIIPLAQNPNMTTYAALSPKRTSDNTDNGILPSLGSINGQYWLNYYNNGYIGTQYGLPSGTPFRGSFKIDNANNLILLNDTFAYEYIIIEYVSSPKEGEEYYVPVQFRNAMIAWIAWQDIQNMATTRRGNLGDKRDRRENYYNLRRLALQNYKPIRLQEEYEKHLLNERQSPKA
jgi:hypothetical protein